jgi:hypothetical protein
VITLAQAVELTRTGDIWIFRGSSGADRAIRGLTNAPVNHVGMAVVIDDLPPLLWHAELGRALVDVWTGTHQRGVQLHDLHAAVAHWGRRYQQRGWLRQLSRSVDADPADTADTADIEDMEDMEDAVLRTIARLDGTPFPSTARLAARWARGRVPPLGTVRDRLLGRFRRRGADPGPPDDAEAATLETAYCAEVVAVTYEEMGLLARRREPNWYDPGRFWSGDDLDLAEGFTLGEEIAVALPSE